MNQKAVLSYHLSVRGDFIHVLSRGQNHCRLNNRVLPEIKPQKRLSTGNSQESEKKAKQKKSFVVEISMWMYGYFTIKQRNHRSDCSESSLI